MGFETMETVVIGSAAFLFGASIVGFLFVIFYFGGV